MLTLEKFNFLTFPIINIPSIGSIVSKKIEAKYKSTLEELRLQEKDLYQMAYIDNDVFPQATMKVLNKIDDFYLFFIDEFEEMLENKEELNQKIYRLVDESYTLSLKITTAIAYIRSKNRQLLKIA